jgi:hypothetical protein
LSLVTASLEHYFCLNFEIDLRAVFRFPADLQVYLVDPREKRPCLKELNDIFKEHLVLQQAAIKQVGLIEKVLLLLFLSFLQKGVIRAQFPMIAYLYR